MFLRSTYNYAIGYANIQVEGYFVERFINLCMNRNIEIWDINKLYDGVITLKIKNSDLTRVDELADITKSKVTVIKESGVPYIAKKYTKRKIFMLLFLMAAVFIYLASLRIWKIDIIGDFSIPIEQVEQMLLAENVYVGMKKKDLDFDKVKNEIYLKRDDILWIGFTIKGTRATVEILERTKKDDNASDNVPCNIVADKDGVVEKISVREGTRVVQKGDVVFKGDILVSGVVESEHSETKYVHSNADILLKTWYIGKQSLPLEKTIVSKTGNVEKKHKIKLGNYTINLTNTSTNFEKYDTITNVKKLILFDRFELPIESQTTVFEEYTTDEIKYTKEQALEIAKSEAKAIADSNVPSDAEIINSDYKFFYTENEVQVRVTNECLERAGTKENL